jgi:hypothetical protein
VVPKMRGRLLDGQVASAHLMGEDAERMRRIGILGVDLQALPVELLRLPRVAPLLIPYGMSERLRQRGHIRLPSAPWGLPDSRRCDRGLR